MYVCVVYVNGYVYAHKGQKKVLDPGELELLEAVSCLILVLGSECESTERSANALNHQAFSLLLKNILYFTKTCTSFSRSCPFSPSQLCRYMYAPPSECLHVIYMVIQTRQGLVFFLRLRSFSDSHTLSLVSLRRFSTNLHDIYHATNSQVFLSGCLTTQTLKLHLKN